MALSINSPTLCLETLRTSSLSSTEGCVRSGVKSALYHQMEVLCDAVDVLAHRLHIVEDGELHELAFQFILEFLAVDQL